MKRGFPQLAAILFLVFSGTASLADSQAIPLGVELTAAQAGHAFGSACKTGQPGRMEKAAVLWETAFGFTPAADPAAEFEFTSPKGIITVTATSGVLNATCEMKVASGAFGDGSDLYDSLESHVAEWWRDSEVTTTAIDGGLMWTWERQDVAHIVQFIERDGAFTVSHTVGR